MNKLHFYLIDANNKSRSNRDRHPKTFLHGNMSRLDCVNDWAERAKKAGYNSKTLAKICQISPSQLRRYFVSVFGQTPKQWMDQFRLWQAAEMLSNGCSVKEIAFDLNFADSAHLCHHFKAYYGCSATEFRKIGNFALKRGPIPNNAPSTTARQLQSQLTLRI